MARTFRVSTNELAKQLDIAPRTVRELRAAEVFAYARDKDGRVLRGRFELQPSVLAYARHVHERDASGSGSESEWTRQRIRKMRADADISELNLKERKGELHAAPVILAVLTSMITEAKTGLQAIPSRVSARLVGETDQKKIYATLDGEIEMALRRISDLRAENFGRQSKEFPQEIRSESNGKSLTSRRHSRKRRAGK